MNNSDNIRIATMIHIINANNFAWERDVFFIAIYLSPDVVHDKKVNDGSVPTMLICDYAENNIIDYIKTYDNTTFGCDKCVYILGVMYDYDCETYKSMRVFMKSQSIFVGFVRGMSFVDFEAYVASRHSLNLFQSFVLSHNIHHRFAREYFNDVKFTCSTMYKNTTLLGHGNSLSKRDREHLKKFTNHVIQRKYIYSDNIRTRVTELLAVQ